MQKVRSLILACINWEPTAEPTFRTSMHALGSWSYFSISHNSSCDVDMMPACVGIVSDPKDQWMKQMFDSLLGLHDYISRQNP